MLRITITLAVVVALASVPRGTEAAQQPCPLYWTVFQNYCYRVFYFYADGVDLYQSEAESYCNQFSSCSGSIAHLPSASTPAEYDFLRVWLGGIIQDLDSEPVFLGLYSDYNNAFFGFDYTKINPDYPYMPTPPGHDALYVLTESGIERGSGNFYVCKMNTNANNHFKDLYFDTTEPLVS